MIELLRAFLFPHVGEIDDAAGDETTDEADDAAGDETTDEGTDDAADTKPDPVEARVSQAEQIAREAQEQVQALQRAAQAKPDPMLDEEERKLRDPNTSDLEKWQIQSNRALRDSQLQSRQALFQAQDMADKTAYTTKAIANPIYSKYESKVEAELAKARAAGQNVSRELILQVLVGRDMLNGNIKSKPAGAAKPTVARGKTPGARSDTPARGSMSEHQKRVARLENTQI